MAIRRAELDNTNIIFNWHLWCV